MKRLAANAALLLATTLLCALLFEAAVRLLDLMEPARWAAFARRDAENARTGGRRDGAPAGQARSNGAPASQWMIHPYRGVTSRPGDRREHWRPDVRNHVLGAVDSIADPRLLSEEELVVAVFGGSVARSTVTTAGRQLARALEKTGWPNGREVRVVNFGISGYKQPQQYFLLAEALLLGVPFDVVINLDGFNEAAIGATDASEGHHPILPPQHFWSTAFRAATGSLSPEQIELTAAAIAQRRRARQIRTTFEESPLRRSALFQAFMGARAARADAAALRLEERLQAMSSESEIDVFSLEDPCLGKPSACWDLVIGLWRRASLGMRALAESHGAVYFHALQPNQYLEASKTLSERELETAWDPGRPWSQAAAEAYPMLRRAGRDLEARGIRWLDMTQIFAGSSETIYVDPCCHYNNRGYILIAERLGREIGERLIAEGRSPAALPPAPIAGGSAPNSDRPSQAR